jgi:hypothetical protein
MSSMDISFIHCFPDVPVVCARTAIRELTRKEEKNTSAGEEIAETMLLWRMCNVNYQLLVITLNNNIVFLPYSTS